MDFKHALGLAVLVFLAGCGVLGGSGTATQTPMDGGVTGTAAPAATPASTATPTATPTVSPTPTPLPENFERRSIRNDSLGTTFDLTGDRDALDSVLTSDITGHRIAQGAALECARTTPFVAVSTNAPVEDVAVSMNYNDSMLPEDARESELSVFVFNRTVEFYLEMETTVDAQNDTASASTISPGQSFTRETENGTETITPTLDGTRLDNAFVVMHEPTFWEAYRMGEVPEKCNPDA